MADMLLEQVGAAERDHNDPDADFTRKPAPERHDSHETHQRIYASRADWISRNLSTGWHGRHPDFAQMQAEYPTWATSQQEHYLSRTHYRDLLSLLFGEGTRIKEDAAKAMEHEARVKFASLPDDVRDYLASKWGWEE